MSDNKPSRYVLQSEDWFCGFGVLLGFAAQFVAAWAHADVAQRLVNGGQGAVAAFFIAWVICKIVRGRDGF